MTTAVHSIIPSELKNKIPDTSVLITTSVLNTEIGEVENKIHGVSCLVNKTDCNAKILGQTLTQNVLLFLITINLQRKYLKRKKIMIIEKNYLISLIS